MWAALGKYKSIVVSIALFLLLDASVLTLNFYISFKIADDAVGVNLAGRQRMLSQRTVKSLYELDSAPVGSEAYQLALQELTLSYTLFDRTLTAFDRGGLTRGADGNEVLLKLVESAEGRQAITDAKQLWAPYSAAIRAVINSADSGAAQTNLAQAISLAQANNVPLLGLMNQLTVDLEHVATSKATTLRYIQTAGISLAIINFLIIIFHFLSELRHNDRQLEAARQETEEILDTVSEGLFLMDDQHKIAGQHSASLPGMFGRESLSGTVFTELIKDLVKPKDLQTAERFIALLFRPDVKSNLIQDLNPLNEVELQIPDQNGGHRRCYLSFDFKRVLSDNEKNVLVTVKDITQSILLAAELEQEKQRNEQQMEMLTGILHTNPEDLADFIAKSFAGFERINKILKDQSKTLGSLGRKLEKIFVEVHSFKGDASALGLENFADYGHQFEKRIKELQDMDAISGNDFLGLAVHLEGLIKYTEDIKGIADKLAQFADVASAGGDNKAPQPASSGKWQKLKELAELVSQREDKQVHVTLTGLSEHPFGQGVEALVNDLCVQFIRNAVVHSIEAKPQREEARKPSYGRIDVQLVELPSGELELSVTDDGQGIDYEKIRKRAVQTPAWSQAGVQQWDQKQLMKLIFEPGFSTADSVTTDAGQGVGMNVIKQRIVDAGGKLKIHNRTGAGCKFVVTLPKAAESELAA